MSGMGVGFGQAGGGTNGFYKGQANSRANRQQEAADKLNKYKEEEAQRKGEASQHYSDWMKQQEEIEKKISSMEKKQAGNEMKRNIREAFASPKDSSAEDIARAVNSSPEMLASIKAEKGDVQAYSAKTPQHKEALQRYLSKQGVDVSKMDFEAFSNNMQGDGLGFMYKGEYVDGMGLAETMGAFNGAPKDLLDKYEEKKAQIFALIPDEEEDEAEMKALKKQTKEQTEMPESVKTAAAISGKQVPKEDKPLSTMGKFMDDFMENGLGTEDEAYEAWKTDRATAKSNRAPTYVEEFRTSSEWMAENADKKGSPEYEQHETVVKRFGNELRTAGEKNNEATAKTIMKKYGVKYSDAMDNNGKMTYTGQKIDSEVRANDKIYTKEVKQNEQAALDTAHSLANIEDIYTKMDKGIKSGKYKTGLIDESGNWLQKKFGDDAVHEMTDGEIAGELETQLGVDSELAIELGRVVRATYGGNASNMDRETIAGAMAGLSSDDEKARITALETFKRSLNKLNTQNKTYLADQGLFKSVESIDKYANTRFDAEGNQDYTPKPKAKPTNNIDQMVLDVI